MGTVGLPEHETRGRVIALFRVDVGYPCLRDWSTREGNTNVEERLLAPWLAGRGYRPRGFDVFGTIRDRYKVSSMTVCSRPTCSLSERGLPGCPPA